MGYKRHPRERKAWEVDGLQSVESIAKIYLSMESSALEKYAYHMATRSGKYGR